MEDTSRLIIASPLSGFENPEFSRWPLHVTLLHWFYLQNQEVQAFQQDLEQLAASSLPIEVKVGEPEMFGENADVAVNVIRPFDALKFVHTRLLQTTLAHGGILESPQWCGDGYRSHVTCREDLPRLKPGLNVTIGRFVLVQAVGEHSLRRKVLSTYVFWNK